MNKKTAKNPKGAGRKKGQKVGRNYIVEKPVDGYFCNCEFKDKENYSFSSKMHYTEIEKDGTCFWCGSYAKWGHPKFKIKEIEIASQVSVLGQS